MPVITVQINTRTGDQVKEPILYKLGHDYNVVTNILRAQVADDYGFIEVSIEGDLEEVQRSISWLMTTGLHINALQRSVGKDTANL